ncbi:DUF1018 domain-containing protein [Geobacter pelophilus]|uniref:DUF1018 domain-containing protein n=1 Tax=Geoanaerobacter pelophilus TaxID=60036 RepID=A0AAW4LCX5_9BACT|nr:regulatory protein GemA [Geoanaerobacter pelophilus]MBT0665737.1 DUF1018 domain-containing protein [Geoanaerobacter pelophilus]
MTKTALKSDKSPRLKLYGRIHSLMAEGNISDEIYRDILFVNFDGAESKSSLTERQLLQLVQHLEALVPGKQRRSYPGRPHNMNRPGQSRTDQLEKIEALLTIGKLPWSYADSIAKQMRLADKVAWVKTEDLYKITTALRKRAQKEGWDLSGETK